MRILIRYFLAILFLGGLWKAAHLALGDHLMPAPLNVLMYIGINLKSATFWEHCASSTGRVTCGLLLAWWIAFPLGLLLGYKKKIDAAIAPLVFLTYPIPKIVLLPVFLTVFGLGNLPRVLIIGMTAGYQILVVTRSAALHLDRRYIDAFKSLHGSSTQLVRHVLIPAVLPDALTSLRVAAGTAVAVLFMVESFATTRGLGFLIMDAWGRGDMLDMFSGILAMSVMGVGLYEGCNLIERLQCPWIRAGKN